MEDPPSKRVKSDRLPRDPKTMKAIYDPISFCRGQVASGYRAIYFIDSHFDEWDPAQALPKPFQSTKSDREPERSVCTQYFELAFPGLQFVDRRPEMIDIRQDGWDLYFFKARSPGLPLLGREVNRLVMASMYPQHAAAARPVSQAFKDAAKDHVRNRVVLDYLVSKSAPVVEQEAVAEQVMNNARTMLDEVKLINVLAINGTLDSAKFSRLTILDTALMDKLLAMTRTLELSRVSTYALDFDIMTLNRKCEWHRQLKIVIKWFISASRTLDLGRGDCPDRVYIERVLYEGTYNLDREREAITRAARISDHVAYAPQPMIEERDGQMYRISLDTGEYTTPM